MKLLDNWFKKVFIIMIGSLFFSYFSYIFPVFNKVLFSITAFLVVYYTAKDLRNGIYFALAELLIGSQGYLFFWDFGGFKLSLRILIFLIVFVFYLIDIIKKREIHFFKFKLRNYYLLLAFIFFYGLLNGYYFNAIKSVFFDANGYFYFAYILVITQVLSLKSDSTIKFGNRVLKICIAGITTMGLHTLGLLYIFSHLLTTWMRPLYKWTRDYRLGEIVRPFPPNNFHRIFFQHQIYSILGIFIIASLIYFYPSIKTKSKKLYYGLTFLLGLQLAIAFLSFSRSFWVGIAGGGILFLLYYIIKFKKDLKAYSRMFLHGVGSLIIAICIIMLTMNFPFPPSGYISSSDLLKNRLNFTDEAAVSSRWKLLPVLTKHIQYQPFFGHGFGKTIRYQSDDPRIREQDSQGWYETFAFEWGYLDVLLKVGLFGLAIYLLLLYQIGKQCIILYQATASSLYKNLILGLFFGFIALLVIHIFTPYINHPLGIGYILLMSMLPYYKNK